MVLFRLILLICNLASYLIYPSCNTKNQYHINQDGSSSLKRKSIHSQPTQQTEKHDIHFTQSRLVQNAINQDDSKAIDRLIPYLDAYAINKWYATNQNSETCRYTLLHWACEHGYLKIVQKLFAHHALNLGCLNLDDNLNNTPLYLALKNAYGDNMHPNTTKQETTESLVYSNRSHNYKTPFQKILQFKTDSSYLQIINMLLQQPEINVNRQDAKIGSPLHYAISFGDELLIDIFLKS